MSGAFDGAVFPTENVGFHAVPEAVCCGKAENEAQENAGNGLDVPGEVGHFHEINGHRAERVVEEIEAVTDHADGAEPASAEKRDPPGAGAGPADERVSE